jgi:excisionase family DNA binding protein
MIQLYTATEVAEICRVTVETVRAWIKEGKLKAKKPGREYLVDEVDLREFLEEKHG